jgi:hypothetical protein
MNINKLKLILVTSLTGILLPVSPFTYGKEVIGWIENVTVHPGNVQIKAKIDSGAKSSSLHCDCPRILRKHARGSINITATSRRGKKVTLRRKIVRTVRIKRHFGIKQRRAIIRLGVCLGSVYKEINVNLVDRGGLNYQMLIGRNFLSGDFLIDTEKTFTKKPKCHRE